MGKRLSTNDIELFQKTGHLEERDFSRHELPRATPLKLKYETHTRADHTAYLARRMKLKGNTISPFLSETM